MRTAVRSACGIAVFCFALALAPVGAPGPLPTPSPAIAAVGGLSVQAPEPIPDPGADPTAPPGVALLKGSRALAPLDAPEAVQRAIAAANRIRTKPYVWGGGHARWRDRGYDCSGAVSYALYGAGLLRRALNSGSMMRWGAPGPGRWITIYANRGHAFAVIAGLRWDTSGGGSSGPRWRPGPYDTRGFVARHPVGY